MELADRSVVVVGSGFGGLSTACYLADAGADVTVVEKNEQLGGRASVLERDGFRFDMGPSWYLMPDVFERFFGHFGRTPGDYYGLEHLDPHYQIFFKDGAPPDGAEPSSGRGPRDSDAVTITADREATKATFEEYEPGAGAALDAYLDEAEETYEIGMEHFVYEDRPRFRDYVDLDVFRHARGLTFLGSMQGHVEDYFDHPKLQQIMQYTLVFLGGSPKNTPALYNLMSHVDFNLGVHYPVENDDEDGASRGGMGVVVDGIAELGAELGVEYRTDAEVESVLGSAGNFRVETEDGVLRSDLVVSDADYAHTEQELLPPQSRQYDADYWESRTYAPSAFLLYLGVEGDVDPLEHHTLVLPPDWNDHFDGIFEDPQWPDDPAYYLCVPSETDETVAPEGHSNLFALVPVAPGLEDGPETRQRYRDLVLEDIAENTGVDLRDRIVVEERFCVSEFADRYNSTKGSALGLAHTLRQTGPLRPGHRSSEVPGLYFTGSFTTPGIGVPMCLISGQHTADAVLEDYGR
ncbi:phytoene desaturase family protein [Halorussus limi]|uniref:Phytoene desaturase family protein n=1 Tax=Halorussus limi TaxID=2938695 RepID=A0A8U0HR96_9EURY|nr:phytoene desaturase family protein [Halorussus limi]UPV73417.1 phytoene desaturase family protein [Halorussus limi]